MADPTPTQPNPYERILSLDGGGTWALIQVHTLMDLFGDTATGHDVLAHFHLVVANSGGAVVAGAMACNLKLADIANLFEDETHRLRIFQKKCAVALRRCLSFPRYAASAKKVGLLTALGDAASVAEMTPAKWHETHPGLAHLLILGFDYDTERATFFRSDANSRAASFPSTAPPTTTILDAVHASSNAPVLYFDEPTRAPAGRRYWDGAIGGYNNPAMAGVVEALANRPRGADRAEIKVLSIGNGTVRRPRGPAPSPASKGLYTGGGKPGIVRDLRKLATSILDDPPDAASFVAHVTLGGALPAPGEVVSEGPIVRMNPTIRPFKNGDAWEWKPTFEPEKWLALAALEMDALSDADIGLVGQLCRAWLHDEAPNQPIRADDRLAAEIGHDWYSHARKAARKLLALS